MVKVYLLLIFIISIPLQVQADIDSLKCVLKEAISNSKRVDALNQIGYEYWIIAPAQSEKYGEEALQLAREINYLPGIAFARRVIGVSHWALGNYELALYYLLEGLKNYEELQDTLGISNVLMNTGLVYSDQQIYDKALDYYFEAINHFRRIKREDRIATTYNKIGAIYLEEDRLEEARNYLLQALSIHTANNFTYGIAETNNRLGRLSLKEQNPDNAIVHFQTSLQLGQSIHDYDGMASNLVSLAEAYIKLNRYESAEKALQQGMEIATEIKAKKWIRDYYLQYKNLYLARNNYTKAFYYYDQYILLKDSLFNEEMANRIADTELANQRRSQERQQAIQAQEIELLDQKNRVNLLIEIILALIIITIIIVSYLIWSRQRLNLKRNRELTLSKEKLNKAELENARLKEMELQGALDFKNKELTSYTISFVQKNELFSQLQEGLKEVLKTPLELQSRKINSLHRLIEQNLQMDKEWEDFKLHFEQVHQHFFTRLKEACPDLSSAELKLCALIRLNLNMKESATILGISPTSVKTARYRLRKKLNLSQEESILDYLLKIESGIKQV